MTFLVVLSYSQQGYVFSNIENTLKNSSNEYYLKKKTSFNKNTKGRTFA